MSKIAETKVLLKKARKNNTGKILLTVDFVNGLLQEIETLQATVDQDSATSSTDSRGLTNDTITSIEVQGGKFIG